MGFCSSAQVKRTIFAIKGSSLGVRYTRLLNHCESCLASENSQKICRCCTPDPYRSKVGNFFSTRRKTKESPSPLPCPCLHTFKGVAARTDSPRGCADTIPPSPKKSPGPIEATLQTKGGRQSSDIKETPGRGVKRNAVGMRAGNNASIFLDLKEKWTFRQPLETLATASSKSGRRRPI